MVDKLLAAGAQVNLQDRKRGVTALLCAARVGYYDTVQRLLRVEGIDLNAGSVNEGTPLWFAIRCSHQQTATALWEAGADVYRQSQRPSKAAPPLRTAATWGDAPIIEFIASRAVCIDRRFDDGHTALTLACTFGQAECVRVSLNAGADVNQTGLLGGTPLHEAVRGEGLPVVPLPECFPLDEDETAKQDCAGVVRLLLAGGARLKADDQGMNPLHVACIENAERCVEVLLEMTCGQAVDTPCKGSGMTALHFAAIKGHAGAVQYLLKWGADVHKQSNSGCTPLYLAVRKNHLEVVRSLIAAGAGQGEKGCSDKAFDYTVLQYASIAMLEALDLDRVPDGSA